MIVIVDYGLGNLRSVLKSFEKLHIEAEISSDPCVIKGADKLVLPGVGGFGKGIRNLQSNGLIEALNEAVVGKEVPTLGICLGLQLMTDWSDEGHLPGLGWIPGETLKFFRSGNVSKLRVPHMAWNSIELKRADPLFEDITPESEFYFVHSYYVRCADRQHVLATSWYGEEFDSVVRKGNILGTQFHPEKSHKHGLLLLRNFAVRC